LSKPKIVSFLGFPKEFIISQFGDRAKEYNFIHGGYKTEITREETKSFLKEADVALAFPGTHDLSKDILREAKNLKLVQFWSVGYDNIDLKAADEFGILVANNPGWNAVSVAEHTIMMILMTLKKVKYANRRSIERGFKTHEFWEMVDNTWEFKDKILGILGLGTIGKEVAKRARSFEPKIIYNKRNRLSNEEEKALKVEYRTFEDLIRESDILTIHTPLNEETEGIIGRSEINMMKNGAILINTARAGIIDEIAVADALESGKLSGVGLDVVKSRIEGDLRILESPLVKYENVVFTPHLSGNTRESHRRSHNQWVKNVCSFLDGKKPLFIVNKVK
jgi:lactate dehydrogenase-like 2-hydroxyacid dehydrogenase